ncbi:MAG TPA: hypothetical protein VM537_32025 [Anaerolineae bacterium]|nr:hypothetical protein [Anaerolineae bacterium]
MNLWDQLVTNVFGAHRRDRIPNRRPKRGMETGELKARKAYRIQRSARNKAASKMRAIQRRRDCSSKRQRSGRHAHRV